MVKKLPISILKNYPSRTACLKVIHKNQPVLWFINADPKKDNEKTLKKHVKIYFPNAILIGWAIK